ncbi:unnamed protein product [Cylindrotheca closterium]|uniref:DUS-like FMN-binding domain-containing protein n=1 Tax=Cylindrotheca closterium TaxID=2856 RepID=A0AAD2CSA4_9STRA|nr:unnamed protein product [Cylindrotheca closterium]
MSHRENVKELHIAPMIDVSTPEFHHLFRILSKRVILWTAMHVDETLVFTDNVDQHLELATPELHPIVCQIGGRTPEYAVKASQMIHERFGYDEINLNIDCPSNRVSGKRCFGAILMADPHKDTAYAMVQAMAKGEQTTMSNAGGEGNGHETEDHDDQIAKDTTSTTPSTHPTTKRKSIPISVKTRVGCETPDGVCLDTTEHLISFVRNLRQHGCHRFYIHARKVVIGGLSPIQNRIVPPLNYPRVYQLCSEFPDCQFVLNAGISGLQAAKDICQGISQSDYEEHRSMYHVASNGSCTVPPIGKAPTNLVGCMLGRACMEHPAMFHDVDRYWYGESSNPCQNRRQVLEQYMAYLQKVYPPRCGDDQDDMVTSRILLASQPLPFHITKQCPICHTNNENQQLPVQSLEERHKQPSKIITRVMDRSFKPILGMFFGLPKSKFYRKELERLSRDTKLRNCGPAHVLKRVLESLPDELLDQDFLPTERMTNIPVHHAPDQSNKRKRSK